MNKIDFSQSGGFPFDQGVLDFLQEGIQTASVAAALAGPLAILSGCEVKGDYMAGGYVHINGEVLPFLPGYIQDKIIIDENVTAVTFQDGSQKKIKFVRVARFGDDGTDNFKYSLFARNTAAGMLNRLTEVEKLANRIAVCEGLLAPFMVNNATMLFWRKLSTVPLPNGWQEVQDWQGRIAMGHTPLYPGRNIGDILGKEGHAMELPNLIEHDHDYRTPGISGAQVDRLEQDLIKKDDDLGLYLKGTKKTGKAGSATPVPIPTIPPVRMIMYIEPKPDFFKI
jgi:hypothetical protein